MLTYILASATAVIMFVADRLSKVYIQNNMELHESATLIPKVFNLYFAHNNGGAWGVLAGYTWVLLTVTAVVMIVGV